MTKKMKKETSQTLIGLMGTIGSGKTTASNYIVKRYKFKRIIMGNLVRAKARKMGLETTRENLLKVQKYYREKYGQEYFIHLALEKTKKWKRALIDGVRVPADAIEIKKAKGKIILIDARPKLRFERLKRRKRKGYSKTFEEFKREEKLERKFINFNVTLKYVDYRIENNTTKEKFYQNIDKLMKKLNIKD